MQQVMVRKQTLEALERDFDRASWLCGSLEKRISDTSDDLDQAQVDLRLKGLHFGLESVRDTIFDASNILHLLSDNFEHSAMDVRRIAEYAAPAPHIAAQVAIPEEVNFLDFQDISTDDLLAEAKRQEEIIVAAELERSILIEAIRQRASMKAPEGEGGDIEDSKGVNAA